MKDTARIIRVGEVTIYPLTYDVKVGITFVDLTRREFALLHYLMRNEGRPVSKQELVNIVWKNPQTLPNTVEVYVKYIRNKLGPDAIKTRRGFGYYVGERKGGE